MGRGGGEDDAGIVVGYKSLTSASSFTCSFRSSLSPPCLRSSVSPPLPIQIHFSCSFTSFSTFPAVLFCSALRSNRCVFARARGKGAVDGVMEHQKEPASSSPPAPSSSSLIADLFGEKNAPKPSPSPFHSVFPPASVMVGKDSSRSVILDPSGKHEAQSQNSARNVSKVASTSVSMCPDSIPEDNGQRDKNPAYQQQKISPCFFSSSLYYGGQDFCFNVSSSRESESNDKKDVDDDSNDPNAVSRGNWWQGSLYY